MSATDSDSPELSDPEEPLPLIDELPELSPELLPAIVELNHWSGPKNSPVELPEKEPLAELSFHPEELVWLVLRV
jgi:hypothetical protein